jgi:hypothetical protein
VEFTALGGLTTAYGGGVTFLGSAVFAKPFGVPLELALEFTPAPAIGTAKILWLGLRHPRGILVNGIYTGIRGGLLDGPSANGWLADVHVGHRTELSSYGFHLERLAGVMVYISFDVSFPSIRVQYVHVAEGVLCG